MEDFTKKPQSIEYKVFADDRGMFAPLVDGLEKIAPDAGSIKRVYCVYNHSRGTVRGFHYHEKEWKFFAAVGGAAKFVVINPEKPEEKYEFFSAQRKNNLIIVPPHYANGWVSLEDSTILICASNLTTDESLLDDKRFDPYVWGDVWSVKAR